MIIIGKHMQMVQSIDRSEWIVIAQCEMLFDESPLIMWFVLRY